MDDRTSGTSGSHLPGGSGHTLTGALRRHAVTTPHEVFIVAETVAAAMNANVGGRWHGAVLVERQVIAWCRLLFGFPDTTSGLLVSGTSMSSWWPASFCIKARSLR